MQRRKNDQRRGIYNFHIPLSNVSAQLSRLSRTSSQRTLIPQSDGFPPIRDVSRI